MLVLNRQAVWFHAGGWLLLSRLLLSFFAFRFAHEAPNQSQTCCNKTQSRYHADEPDNYCADRE
jgi:hypothetical protein